MGESHCEPGVGGQGGYFHPTPQMATQRQKAMKEAELSPCDLHELTDQGAVSNCRGMFSICRGLGAGMKAGSC